jgi:formyl-CoA transferase
LFATQEARKENAPELYAILQSQFETKPRSHWSAQFRTYDIKWSPLPTLEEAVADPQMRDCGAIVNIDYPGRGKLETISSPVFVADSAKRTPQPPPNYGQHTRAILKEAGFSATDIDKLIASGVAVARDGK